MNWRDYVSVDPNVCHGKPCVTGTRVMVSVILDNLAAGQSVDEILAAYPSVTVEAVRATLAYAAELARAIGGSVRVSLRFKVDENLPVYCVDQLRGAGYDAVRAQPI